KNVPQGIRYFPQRDIGADGGDDVRHQVVRAAGRAGELFAGGLDLACGARGLELAQALDLLALDRVVDAVALDGGLLVGLVAVDAAAAGPAALAGGRGLAGGLLDLGGLEAAPARADRAAHLVDALDVVAGAGFDVVGQRLDGVAAGERIDEVGHARLEGDDLL